MSEKPAIRMDMWGGAFSVEVPEDWQPIELDDVIEIEVPGAALHFSVYSRDGEEDPKADDALWFVREFIDGRGTEEPVAYKTPEGFAATGSYMDHGLDSVARWEVGARVSSKRAVVYSYNDDGRDDVNRQRALAVFDSVRVA